MKKTVQVDTTEAANGRRATRRLLSDLLCAADEDVDGGYEHKQRSQTNQNSSAEMYSDTLMNIIILQLRENHIMILLSKTTLFSD